MMSMTRGLSYLRILLMELRFIPMLRVRSHLGVRRMRRMRRMRIRRIIRVKTFDKEHQRNKNI